MLLVDGMTGHQPPVFGVKHEDEPHERRDQSAVEVIGIAPRDVGHGSAAARVCRDEAPKQFMQRREHLTSKSRGDFGLRIAALGQKRRQPSLGVTAEECVRRQKHVECGQDGPACRLRHLRELEGYIARRLALGRVDQTDTLIGAK